MSRYNETDDRVHIDLNRKITLEMAGKVNCPINWQGVKHRHPFWELIFLFSGSGRFWYQGREFKVQTNDIFLIPPFQEHQFFNTGKTIVENVYVGFDSNIKFLRKTLDSIEPVFSNTLDPEQIKELRIVLSSIIQNKTSQAPATNQLFGLISNFINSLRKNNNGKSVDTESEDPFIDNVKTYIRANVYQKLNVEKLAFQFGKSPLYFGKKFKRGTGLTLKDFHNLCQMDKARDMLQNPSNNISEVAFKLGFENIYYFSNKFKNQYGKSPSEYRNALR